MATKKQATAVRCRWCKEPVDSHKLAALLHCAIRLTAQVTR